jgi:hypothetical protein
VRHTYPCSDLSRRVAPYIHDHDLKEHCEFALLATFGLHGGMQEWEGIPVFPGGADAFSNDVIAKAARAWRADIVITLKDTIVFNPQAFQGLRWLPMVPIDHDPVRRWRLSAHGHRTALSPTRRTAFAPYAPLA